MAARPDGTPLSRAQRLAWLRLIRTDNVGPVTFRQLLNRFGGAEAALDALPALSRSAGAAVRIFSPGEVEAELEATPRERRQVPGGVGGERRAPHEGEGDARADRQPLGVLGDEQRHAERVVHGLGHVEPVEAHGLDPPGVPRHVPQRQPRVHAGVHGEQPLAHGPTRSPTARRAHEAPRP